MIQQQAKRALHPCLLLLALCLGLGIGSSPAGAGAAESCKEWVAKVVSLQGRVQARRAGEARWLPVRLNDTYCPGDMIHVEERGRAAVLLRNQVVFRLDQRTTVTFSGLEREKTSLLELLMGSAHFFSRVPQGLRVITPFVNAAVEGTEFFLRVEPDQAFLSIFEGQVAAINEAGSLTLVGGQAALARKGEAPVLLLEVRPRDAVRWALYYPPILDYRPEEFPDLPGADWPARVRSSLDLYWRGDLAGAFASLEGAPEDLRDPRFFTYRAALLLTVGRVEEARGEIERALALDPSSGHAFALQSVIAVVQNDKDQALELARRSVALAPQSSAARVALSYAQQAHFDLPQALASLQEAVALDPANALARARLSELWLSLGDLDRALAVAREAVTLNPYLARTQTVLGFAFLSQVETREAKSAFEKAIGLDPADPLPRLGLGLAKIRTGEVKAGRGEIEIAVILDPNNALIRSYLGKAYFEEKRDQLGRDELAMAKALDPLDPTPWYYDAIRKQTVNRPVEALQDLQRSIELNDNRAPYRSRLLLDDDLAARSASLGRIYRDLGFQQLALVEGWKSLNTDPSNHSAHRFLADSYAGLPRHEIARVSELLQAQLLQPINITPIQPQLAESNLSILEGAGPTDPSFNEFNPLFHRDRFALQPSSVVSENNTVGDELVQSGVFGRWSYSLGQFHYETDGFRKNNDLEQDIYNAFAQVSLSPKTSLQAEFRRRDTQSGDLALKFDRDNFERKVRREDRVDSVRLGFRHVLTPYSDIIASTIYLNKDLDIKGAFGGILNASDDINSYMAEAQYLFRSGRFHATGGMGRARRRQDLMTGFTFSPKKTKTEEDDRHTNFYLYSQANYPKPLTWTLGGSVDLFESDFVDRNQFNPKLGLTWSPFPSTMVRAAAFRTLKRTLLSNQTIEPTQVAGFNQFFDDGEATESWRYGIAIDQRLFTAVYGGVEFSRREMKVPFSALSPPPAPPIATVRRTDWEESLTRAYFYWTPFARPAAREEENVPALPYWIYGQMVVSAEYQYERLKREARFGSPGDMSGLYTHRLLTAISFFGSSGLSGRVEATHIDQKGKFGDPMSGFLPKNSHFWVVNAYMGFRLPRRWGIITIEARNLLDKEFNLQEMESAMPRIYPERMIFVKFTLSF
ncbi:MAG: TonB-dependent receptor [Candidatus Tectomicrobia bacterium]|uniref:TonB-dependent receptor n=1 Tax=Tectimicrobiota bacterium TaxID=2528274 RepID=A0A932CRM9_UNCTE|nr:TonB-dependent receptor [Candidatus Tectomicrobia bacterium]